MSTPGPSMTKRLCIAAGIGLWIEECTQYGASLGYLIFLVRVWPCMRLAQVHHIIWLFLFPFLLPFLFLFLCFCFQVALACMLSFQSCRFTWWCAQWEDNCISNINSTEVQDKHIHTNTHIQKHTHNLASLVRTMKRVDFVTTRLPTQTHTRNNTIL